MANREESLATTRTYSSKHFLDLSFFIFEHTAKDLPLRKRYLPRHFTLCTIKDMAVDSRTPSFGAPRLLTTSSDLRPVVLLLPLVPKKKHQSKANLPLHYHFRIFRTSMVPLSLFPGDRRASIPSSIAWKPASFTWS
jgi:hypothetical protein